MTFLLMKIHVLIEIFKITQARNTLIRRAARENVERREQEQVSYLFIGRNCNLYYSVLPDRINILLRMYCNFYYL